MQHGSLFFMIIFPHLNEQLTSSSPRTILMLLIEQPFIREMKVSIYNKKWVLVVCAHSKLTKFYEKQNIKIYFFGFLFFYFF